MKRLLKKIIKKKIIILDRFTESTIAYQHYGMGLSISLIKSINKLLLREIKPAKVFLNIISIKNLKKRLKIRKKKNRYDNFKINFYNKVQKGFIKLSKDKKKYVIINSNHNLDQNKKIILKQMIKLIKK